MKYNKNSQNYPKFEHGVLNNVGRPHKKNEAKKQKKQKIFPECLSWHSGKAASSPSALFWHSGKGLFPECQERHSGKNFFKF